MLNQLACPELLTLIVDARQRTPIFGDKHRVQRLFLFVVRKVSQPELRRRRQLQTRGEKGHLDTGSGFTARLTQGPETWQAEIRHPTDCGRHGGQCAWGLPDGAAGWSLPPADTRVLGLVQLPTLIVSRHTGDSSVEFGLPVIADKMDGGIVTHNKITEHPAEHGRDEASLRVLCLAADPGMPFSRARRLRKNRTTFDTTRKLNARSSHAS